MEDMLQETNGTVLAGFTESTTAQSSIAEQAGLLGALLREHNGQDVSVLDLRGMNNWTDFFIIVTVTSNVHMEGLERHIKEFCHEKEITILGKSRKTEDDEWRLIDLGSLVIHLMNKRARDFYELERLWARTNTVELFDNFSY